ncbi:MAG: ribulokinase [Gaiellales bacterium]
MSRYSVGVDFGTESARAVLVDCADGREVATAVCAYPHGVIDERLPAPYEDVQLEPEWALQDPDDYLHALGESVHALLTETGISPAEVIGIGIDFTSCTMLPATYDGTPLCRLVELRREPHAWVKLWKHHAAQPEADLINATAATRGEPWLARYGGKISAEWFIAKSLQILLEAPELYARADRLIDAGDWIVWQLTGRETRSSCTAGYKAMWSRADGFPSDAFFAALDPRFEHVIDQKMTRNLSPVGDRAGLLSPEAAALTGLLTGTAVAVANVDAHVSAPAARAVEAGAMVMAMGTSTCHILLGDHAAEIAGICGVVQDGVVPGLYGFEAGQSAVGDIFAWFVENATTPAIHDEARRRGLSVNALLEEQAASSAPGESGLLALDWWNGNRSLLVDVELRGLLVGMTLATRPAEIYRALIEATAFGTRMIIEAFEKHGVPVTTIIACGGLPERNKLLMQIYADVAGRRIEVASSRQTPALGAAIFGAVAAGAAIGGYDSILTAASRMTRPAEEIFEPLAANHSIYTQIYGEYRRMHDLFGRSDDLMKTLKRIQHDVSGQPRAVAPAREAPDVYSSLP